MPSNAAERSGITEIYDTARHGWTISAGGLLFISLAILCFQSGQPVMGIAISIGAAIWFLSFFLTIAVLSPLDRKKPYLTLSKYGFYSSHLMHAIPWDAISHIEHRHGPEGHGMCLLHARSDRELLVRRAPLLRPFVQQQTQGKKMLVIQCPPTLGKSSREIYSLMLSLMEEAHGDGTDDSVAENATVIVDPPKISTEYSSRFFAKRGFAPGLPIERKDIPFGASNAFWQRHSRQLEVVLLYADGLRIDENFPVTREQLVIFAHEMKRKGEKASVLILIIRSEPLDQMEKIQVRQLTREHGVFGIEVNLVVISTKTNEVWCASICEPWFVLAFRRELLERDETGFPISWDLPEDYPPPRSGTTRLLILLLAFTFTAELYLAYRTGSGWPDAEVLSTLGSMNRPLVWGGEWWRLFTAGLLHTNIFHLLVNGIFLHAAGPLVEGFLGRAWLMILFSLGIIFGNLVSLFWGSASGSSVGASGGLLGLLGGVAVMAARLKREKPRTELRLAAILLILPSLLPSRRSNNVDFLAHYGGLAGGILGAAVLLALWPKGSARPRGRRWVVKVGAGLSICTFAASVSILYRAIQ